MAPICSLCAFGLTHKLGTSHPSGDQCEAGPWRDSVLVRSDPEHAHLQCNIRGAGPLPAAGVAGGTQAASM